MNNLEGTYRKYLYTYYRFHSKIPEQKRRDKAFKKFMMQIAHHCRNTEYNPELFKNAREIKDVVYPFFLFK